MVNVASGLALEAVTSIYGVVCYKYPVKDKWVTVHVHRLSAMLHLGYHEFDASVVASQLSHNCTVSWSEAHYSGTSDRPEELGAPSLATFPTCNADLI